MNKQLFLYGLNVRLQFGERILKREDFPADTHVSREDISLQSLLTFFSADKPHEIEHQICTVCVKFRSIPEQQRFLSQFIGHPIVKQTFLLTVGGLFDPDAAESEAIVEPGDYSIVKTLELITSTSEHQDVLRASRRSIRKMLAACEIRPATNMASLTRYLGHLNLVLPNAWDLQRLATAFQQLKEQYWALFGPDLPSVFQALCDPLHHFTLDQLTRIDLLTELWGLRQIFHKLCLVRAVAGYENERTFIKSDPNIVGFLSINQSTREAIKALFAHEVRTSYVRCTASLDTISYIIAAFINIELAIRNRDLMVLKRQVADLYQRDQSAHLFLDWESIHNTFELPAIEADVYTIFLKLLMLHPTIGKRFLTVALARGKGHLVADLTSFTGRIRADTSRRKRSALDRGNVQFIRLARKLPRAAAERLIEEVTEKGMMERLAFAFAPSLKLAASALPKVDNQASILRLEFANLALRHGVLNERSANRMIEEETHFLRMHKFHTLFRAGRVKIDWEFLGSLVEALIDEDFGFLVSDSADRVIDKSVLNNVIKLFSEELSNVLLFDSESSLEQALNNNVRHGVLVPRFVKEFNEALVDALDYQGHPGDLSDDSYSRFGKHSRRLLTLKEHVTNQVNAYKDFWLTVQRDGEFQQSTRDMIAAVMQTISKDADSHKLSKAIISEFQTQVEKILAQALEVFLHQVKPSVFGEIAECRRDCSKQPSKTVTTFLDLLETRIEKAFEEISDWLGLAKITTDVPDFELIDLIRFEAVTLIFSDFKKLHFSHGSFVKKDGKMVALPRDPRIKGAYFEVTQEIVHNLISNALKHSGLGMNTAINMAVQVDDNDLIFRCTNSFSKKRFVAISATANNVTRLIKTSLPSQGSKDSQSGFSKIKNVCSRVLFEDITINISPISERNLQYTVEIRVPNATTMMLA
ncbi:hypothetical protein [Bradyrhizobium vignae]|uniref:Uncharacterized protein n=1 Tax=Bradyrhizobium vignae TaxID=1549949 RepID=A0A2U3QAB4_9BRAD|nr:hypothetical protein [Bradyrhizobium vignae]SPP98326.1 protein of unknown function [Bradyrhizobium vignae]